MRKTYRVVAHLIAALVVVQAMAIAWALSGLSHWVGEDGGVLNKAVMEDRDSTPFPEVAGFAIHGINGTTLIPLLAVLLLVFSFFAKVADGTKWAAIVFVLVALQVVMGISSESLPFLGLLHALNAFAILVIALRAARASLPAVGADARVGAPA